MKEIVYDVEANGLLDTVSKVWVICCVDSDGSNKKLYTDHKLIEYKKDGNLEDGVKYLMQADKLICHNTAGYDTHIFEKFFPHIWKTNFKKMWDTFIQSKAQHFNRPRLKGHKGAHGLGHYGELLGLGKPVIDDWSFFSEDKLHRCITDVEINRLTYHYLNDEAKKIGLDFTTQIRRSQAAQYWSTIQEMNGWFGNVELMKECVEELDDMIEELRQEIEPHLPPIIKPKGVKCTWEDIRDKWDKFFRKVPRNKYDEDGKIIKPAVMPAIKWTVANGNYNHHTKNHFKDWLEKWPGSVAGAHSRITIEAAKMSQHERVKQYLLDQGWVPTTFNYEKDSNGKLVRDAKGKLIEKSPKLTEDSFDSIQGDIGKKIANYNTYMHRRRTFQNEKDPRKGWINQLRKDGRISTGCQIFSTSSGRSSQSGIVNIPSAAALYGDKMRKVWSVPEGKILVSVDQNASQVRLLANYMQDEAFTESVLSGVEFDDEHKYVGSDVHTLNARAFGLISDDLWNRARGQDPEAIAEVSKHRKTGKGAFYCLLFGGADLKLGQTLKLGGAKEGEKARASFLEKLKGAARLTSSLEKQWNENKWRGGGYIEVAGDTWVWVQSKHALLNYKLQGSEAALQNMAICWVNREMQRRKLNGKQLANIHKYNCGFAA